RDLLLAQFLLTHALRLLELGRRQDGPRDLTTETAQQRLRQRHGRISVVAALIVPEPSRLRRDLRRRRTDAEVHFRPGAKALREIDAVGLPVDVALTERPGDVGNDLRLEVVLGEPNT